MKHTQGDWKIDREKDCIRMNGIVICKLGHNTAGLMMPENQEKADAANAVVLSAASDLLAACEGDEANGVPNAQLILVQAMLGDYETVKTMLREMCSVHAAAICKATGGK